MTNESGLLCAASRHAERGRGCKYTGTTLGHYRRDKWMPWIPGATIDVWTPCARQESATGVPWPHCYFMRTIGDPEEILTIHCATCTTELAIKRSRPKPPPPPPIQGSLF